MFKIELAQRKMSLPLSTHFLLNLSLILTTINLLFFNKTKVPQLKNISNLPNRTLPSGCHSLIHYSA